MLSNLNCKRKKQVGVSVGVRRTARPVYPPMVCRPAPLALASSLVFAYIAVLVTVHEAQRGDRDAPLDHQAVGL